MRVGLYHVFIQDWLEAFPSDQVLVLSSDQTNGHDSLRKTYSRVFKFLGLSEYKM